MATTALLFGQNRTHDITTDPLRFGGIPIDENWKISLRQGRGDTREFHRARSHRQTMQKQLYDRNQRWGRGRACVVERGESTPGPLSSMQQTTTTYATGMHDDIEDDEIADIVLQAVLPPPPTAFLEKYSADITPPSVTGIVSEWGVEGIVPSHPAVEHVELIRWRALMSRFDITYASFWGTSEVTTEPDEDKGWRYVDLPKDNSDWEESADASDVPARLPAAVHIELSTTQATEGSEDTIELSTIPDI